MEPVGLALGLISTTAALAVKVGVIIADLSSASDEFQGVLSQFAITKTAIDHLSRLFKNTSLPPTLMAEYETDLKIYNHNIDNLGRRLKWVKDSLSAKSRLERIFQKYDLVHGDLQRLTDEIIIFNSNLNLMVSTYACIVIGRVHDSTSRLEAGIGRVEASVGQVDYKVSAIRGSGIDINREYVEAAIRVLQEEALGGAREPMDPPRYEDIQASARMGPHMSTMGYSYAPPETFSQFTTEFQSQKTQYEPVPTTGPSRYPQDSKQPMFVLTNKAEEPPSTGWGMTGYPIDSKVQSEFLQDTKGLHSSNRYSPHDLSGILREQEEIWNSFS